MTDQPLTDILVVEAIKVTRGDTLVVCTKESLSRELLMQMRGALSEHFDKLGVNVIIMAADHVYLLQKESQ